MSVIGIIPARLQSTRLPRKLMRDDTGKPLIQYAWEAATQSELLDDVIVATDSEEIADVVREFGGRAELTGEHPSGTDRVAEVVRRCCTNAEIIVNLQGDEPELEAASIDLLIEKMCAHPSAEMATLATPLWSAESVRDPGNVKALLAADGRALYFSRAPIPFVREQSIDAFFEETAKPQAADVDRFSGLSTLNSQPSPWLLHLGIYAYRRDFLLTLARLPPSRLEQLEKLEQLRALEAGAVIQVGIIDHRSVGIDTPEDYAQFVQRERERAA